MLKKLFKESRTEKRGSVKIFTPPQKFWYATDEQAKFMAKAEEKHLKKDKNPIEFILLKKIVLPNYDNIVDLGCGDASRTKVLITKKTKKYYGIDINKKFLEMARKNIPNHVKKIFIKKDLQDIKSPLEDKPTLYVMLGCVYGNFDKKFTNTLFKKIVREKDGILLGFQLREKKTLQSYISNKYLKEFYLNAFKKLGHSKNNEIEYIIRWRKIDGRKCIQPIIKVHIPNKRLKDMGINTGDLIQCIPSWKPTKKEIEEDLSKSFNIQDLISDEKNSYVIVYLKKK